jgi:hypothetical protein
VRAFFYKIYKRAFLRGASRPMPNICASIVSSEVSAAGCGARRGEAAGRLVESLAGEERVLRDALRFAPLFAFLIAFAAAGFLAIVKIPCCFVFSPF